ncbi:MAG: hypothetical protein J6N18_10675 [Kiritimatiellae bacterium]|nr:hypothetical protein [Kiritimatiellia bacterium]
MTFAEYRTHRAALKRRTETASRIRNNWLSLSGDTCLHCADCGACPFRRSCDKYADVSALLSNLHEQTRALFYKYHTPKED